MKKTILLLLTSCMFTRGYTQNEEPAPPLPFHIQVGFNASDFIRQYIVLNSSNLNLPASPYLLNGKLLVPFGNADAHLKLGARVGFDYQFKENSSTNNNASGDFRTTVEKSDLRVGLELQKTISKRFVVFFGADYIMHNESNNTYSRFSSWPGPQVDPTITVDKLYYHGAGGALGLQFNINRYLNVNTEFMFGYKNGQGSTTIQGPNFPDGQHDASGIREFYRFAPSFININFML